MDESKNIVIKITLTGDGKVQLDQVTSSVEKLTKATNQQEKASKSNQTALKGTEAALKQQIRELTAVRAANATTSKSYAEYTKQIDKVQIELQQLQSVQQEAIQTNADQISSAGLAGATLNEFGRFISDLPFGITAVTNNLSQLANLFTILAAKVNGGRKAFALLIKELRGPLGLIIGFQVAIALLQGFQKEILKFIGITDEAKEKLKEFKKALDESLGSVEKERVELLSLVEVIKDSNSSRDAQIAAAQELDGVLDGLTQQEILNKDAIEDTTQAIEDYIDQQAIRAEIDALVDSNLEVFQKRAAFRRIQDMDAGAEQQKALDDFIKANTGFFEKFRIAAAQRAGGVGGLAAIPAGLAGALFGLTGPERQQALNDIVTDMDTTVQGVLDTISDLRKGLTPDDDSGGKRDRVSSVLGDIKKLKDEMSKTTVELNEQEKENRQKAINRVRALIGLPPLEGDATLSKLLEEAQEAAQLGLDIFADTILQQNDFEKRLHEERMNRLSEENDKREQIANNIIQGITRLSQIQDQSFTAQIKRLDTERDIILQNDNLTSEEKERLLKKNDKDTRRIRTQQVKFERDMLQIEMAMELSKIALQIKSKIIDLEAAGALSVMKGQSSLGAFVNQLGAAGIIAYAASIGGIIATIVSARKKARQQIQSLTNASAGVSETGGPNVSAPAFNVVGATETSQLAQTIAGAEDKPIKAFVVASDVTTAQELERSTIEGASLG